MKLPYLPSINVIFLGYLNNPSVDLLDIFNFDVKGEGVIFKLNN